MIAMSPIQYSVFLKNYRYSFKYLAHVFRYIGFTIILLRDESKLLT